jgi:hypothetical protein
MRYPRRVAVGHASDGCQRDGLASLYGRTTLLTGSVLGLGTVWCIGGVDGPGNPRRGSPSGVCLGGERCEGGYVFVECACASPRACRSGEQFPADVFQFALMMSFFGAHTALAVRIPLA